MAITTEAMFAPPGPGSWLLDYVHWTRPATRFLAEVFPEQFVHGFQESLRRYGLLLDYIDLQFVNGFPYACPRAVGAPKDAVGHPPKHVWDELMHNHPEISQRLKTSARALERKLWREDLRTWDQETKPAAIRDNLELQAVDPSTLSTEALLAHLDRCRENLKHQFYLHYLYNVPAFVPVGDFLVHAQEWTGRPHSEFQGLLQGATPVSRGSADALEHLAQAIRGDSRARALIASSGAPREVLDSLRGLSGEVAAALSAYLEFVGYRVVNGEDVGEPYALEMPEILLKAIRSAVEGVGVGGADDALAQHTAEVRAAVPEPHRNAFDELLTEARTMHRLRDERALFCNQWAEGITRRAILAAGKPLAENGRIEQPMHLAEAGYDEMRSLIRHGDGPAAEDLAQRARYRAEANFADAPPVLGAEPGAPLPAEWLPPAAARMERAVGAYLGAVFMAPEVRSEAQTVRGLAVSPGVYEGSARLIHGAQDFARIEKGDVLVTRATSPAFNTVLPLLGAIVTDRGGLLSHAAIVAREYGIPAIVGCIDASARIPDTARVRVDGNTGEVVIVA
ncbi:MAG TPA: PEP-utilizing enzyme [Chloroflexota bacterium]|nr:PEP-utilizing enzyme [Chloroflexota bacterium]